MSTSSRRRGIAWTVVFSAVGVGLHVLGTAVGSGLLGSTLAAVVWAAVLGHRQSAMSPFKDPPAPVAPVLELVALGPVPPEPDRRVLEESDSCVICGRPLTNADSSKARVGTQCIQVHGPRFKMVENLAWVRWSTELVAARAEQAQRQAEADAAHSRAVATHAQQYERWQEELASPEAAECRAGRDAVKARYGLAPWATPLAYAMTALLV
ncbi:hypothetical protein [Phycicoccus sp. DTK01]|uniref:hypothetical protein n=1 Tax=Phycicoccus sp. DTK01 TaxID=2785745 RepID=UPI001A8F92AC|nr:hypothetical protein [Phycicoccus sp. DTK01]GIL33979.1 hypothetical protein PDTK01_00560 [Phycicoccus sp. DTK01]